MTTTQARPDTRDMIMVHNTFRRCFGDLDDLIRGVAPGDIGRATIVAGFYTEVAEGLHHHHEGEDDLLWPLLHERVGPDEAMVERMEEQHTRVAGLLERARHQIVPFRDQATESARDTFAQTVADLDTVLREHLADEEAHILPLAAEHLTVAEWQALGDRGRAGIPKDRLLIQVGYLLDGLPADESKAFLAELPFPARAAWRLVGRRKYRTEVRRIYGS